MNVVLLDGQLPDPPPVDPAGLIQELTQPDGYFAFQDPFAVLGYPHEVDLEPMLGMSPFP